MGSLAVQKNTLSSFEGGRKEDRKIFEKSIVLLCVGNVVVVKIVGSVVVVNTMEMVMIGGG